jgi:5-formyltetrahydrofolate cyclo-ligase
MVTLHVVTLIPAKDSIRRRVWEALQDAGVARFPGAWGRIPNFRGAEAAAQRLRQLDIWKNARSIKCNPDAPQLPVRKAALEDGKTVYMAVPRLRSEQCFLELDAERLLASQFRRAASIAGSSQFGRPVDPRDMPRIDLVVTGVVAATREGARLGKGGGYSDLEYALLAELGMLDSTTPIVTTAHTLQVVYDAVPVERHDISLDFIVTPGEAIECPRVCKRPRGIDWSLLSRERIEEMPALFQLWREASHGRPPALRQSWRG